MKMESIENSEDSSNYIVDEKLDAFTKSCFIVRLINNDLDNLFISSFSPIEIEAIKNNAIKDIKDYMYKFAKDNNFEKFKSLCDFLIIREIFDHFIIVNGESIFNLTDDKKFNDYIDEVFPGKRNR